MLHALARNWWAILLRGIAALVFGLCALFWPGAAGIALVILFGAYALVDGIFALVAAVRAVESHERWMALALEGVVGIAIAAVTYFDLRLTASALFLTIAAWAVLTGILEIVAAIQLRKVLPNDWLLLLGGIASIVFGALMVAFPLAGAVTVIYLIGAYAIVFGVGEEGARRKAEHQPLVTKPVSCELGNVSPVVIVPGEWNAKELDYQARHVASMIANNAGFNCLTPRVIVTSKGWAQREEFLDALERVFASLAPRRAYYPGAEARRADFLSAHPDAHQIGSGEDGAMPWTLIRDVDAQDPNEICLNVEAFCALTSETALDASSPIEFLAEATEFCNERIWGTLSMTLLCDPRTLKQPGVAAALERAVADLRYGSIGVNLWHAMSFAFATTAWGAYPGHEITDIQSGSGFVGNSFLFSQVQKSVVRGPFVASPAPAWFVTNRHAHVVLAKLLDFEAHPSWSKLPALLVAAFRK